MKVKIIDESHEKDLEEEINKFLNNCEFEIIDIKFNSAVAILWRRTNILLFCINYV